MVPFSFDRTYSFFCEKAVGRSLKQQQNVERIFLHSTGVGIYHEHLYCPPSSSDAFIPFDNNHFLSLSGPGPAIGHKIDTTLRVRFHHVIPRHYLLIPQAPLPVYRALGGPPAQWKLQLQWRAASQALTQVRGRATLFSGGGLDIADEGGTARSLVAVSSCPMGPRGHLKPEWGPGGVALTAP